MIALEAEVDKIHVRYTPDGDSNSWISTFGTYDGGGELMTRAWPKLHHVFAIRRPKDIVEPTDANAKPLIHYGIPNIPSRLLNKHPVDLLVVDRSGLKNQAPKAHYVFPWETSVNHTKLSNRPKVIVESWNPICNTWQHGPTEKGCITRWETLGYKTRMKIVDCTCVGGAIRQARLLVARVGKDHVDKWIWPSMDDHGKTRPMANLLTPPGLIRHQVKNPKGTVISDASTDPMPGFPGALIRTNDVVRALQVNEFNRGLGFSKSTAELVTKATAQRTTSLFHWEYLSPIFCDNVSREMAPIPTPSIPVVDLMAPLVSEDKPPSFDFTWKPPDLQVGSEWHQQRVQNLSSVCSYYENPQHLFDE